MLFGFMNTTQLTFSPNKSVCVDNSFTIYETYSDVQQTSPGLKHTLKAVNLIVDMAALLYPTGTACKNGFDETTGVLINFKHAMMDWQVVKFNLFFYSGNIVSSVKNLVLYFYSINYTRVQSPFEVGLELGQIFWYIFNPGRKHIESIIASAPPDDPGSVF